MKWSEFEWGEVIFTSWTNSRTVAQTLILFAQISENLTGSSDPLWRRVAVDSTGTERANNNSRTKHSWPSASSAPWRTTALGPAAPSEQKVPQMTALGPIRIHANRFWQFTCTIIVLNAAQCAPFSFNWVVVAKYRLFKGSE